MRLLPPPFPTSAQLGIFSVVLALLIGVPGGDHRRLETKHSWLDYTSTFGAVLFLSIPNLVLSPILIWIFSLRLGWLPVASWGAKPPFELAFSAALPRSVQLGVLVARHHAGFCPGHLSSAGILCPPDARQPATGDPRRLYPHSARQRAA
jgi:ABC-type dipeptide/oligopeptide/nickel transport system permease component